MREPCSRRHPRKLAEIADQVRLVEVFMFARGTGPSHIGTRGGVHNQSLKPMEAEIKTRRKADRIRKASAKQLRTETACACERRDRHFASTASYGRDGKTDGGISIVLYGSVGEFASQRGESLVGRPGPGQAITHTHSNAGA